MNIYAEWLMEFEREKLGLNPDDTSKDDEIIAKLQSGEKISKSKHMVEYKLQKGCD